MYYKMAQRLKGAVAQWRNSLMVFIELSFQRFAVIHFPYYASIPLCLYAFWY
jgi:hypothetical protein